MSAAFDYWLELEEADVLAKGGRGILLSELPLRTSGASSECHDCGAESDGLFRCVACRTRRKLGSSLSDRGKTNMGGAARSSE